MNFKRLSNSIQLKPFEEADGPSTCRKIPRILLNLEFYYRLPKNYIQATERGPMRMIPFVTSFLPHTASQPASPNRLSIAKVIQWSIL
jgi:hypothetical protein